MTKADCPFCNPQTFVEDGTVYVDGQCVPLSRNQISIFSTLWDRKGKITPHWLLWDAQWDDNWPDKAGKITMVQMHYLRKKLAPTSLEITNIVGQGYLLR